MTLAADNPTRPALGTTAAISGEDAAFSRLKEAHNVEGGTQRAGSGAQQSSSHASRDGQDANGEPSGATSPSGAGSAAGDVRGEEIRSGAAGVGESSDVRLDIRSTAQVGMLCLLQSSW